MNPEVESIGPRKTLRSRLLFVTKREETEVKEKKGGRKRGKKGKNGKKGRRGGKSRVGE